MAKKKVKGAYVLTGGGTGALDSEAIADLSDLDSFLVNTDGTSYLYSFDSVATDAESSPLYIRPDDYVSAGVHKLQDLGAKDIILEGGSLLASSEASGILTLGATGGTNNEKLTFDFESNDDTVTIGTSTGIAQINTNVNLNLRDDVEMWFGNSVDAALMFHGGASIDSLKLGLKTGSNAQSGYFNIMEYADLGSANRSPSAFTSHPTLRIYSTDATQANDIIEFYHDTTNPIIDWGGGDLLFNNGASSDVIFSSGSVGMSNQIFHNGDADTYIEFTNDQIDLVAGGVTMISLDETTQDILHIGSAGVDIDLAFYSISGTASMFMQGSDGKAGFGGITTPSEALDINGNISLSGNIIHQGDTNTFIAFTTDQINFTAGGIVMLSLDETTQDVLKIGQASTDVDIEMYCGVSAIPYFFMEGSSGRIAVGGDVDPLAQFDIEQRGSSAAIPCLRMQQDDVSEPFILFQSTIAVGNAIEAVGAKTLTTTHFIKINISGVGDLYMPVGTIA